MGPLVEAEWGYEAVESSVTKDYVAEDVAYEGP